MVLVSYCILSANIEYIASLASAETGPYLGVYSGFSIFYPLVFCSDYAMLIGALRHLYCFGIICHHL